MTNSTDDTQPITDPAEPARPRRTLRTIAIGAGAGLIAAAVIGGVGYAVADGVTDRSVLSSADQRGDDDDRTATPAPSPSESAIGASDREKASAAALAAAGGGIVTDLDRSDDHSDDHSDDRGKAWEVEVLLDNGDEVEVELDAAFRVLRTELDPRDGH